MHKLAAFYCWEESKMHKAKWSSQSRLVIVAKEKLYLSRASEWCESTSFVSIVCERNVSSDFIGSTHQVYFKIGCTTYCLLVHFIHNGAWYTSVWTQIDADFWNRAVSAQMQKERTCADSTISLYMGKLALHKCCVFQCNTQHTNLDLGLPIWIMGLHIDLDPCSHVASPQYTLDLWAGPNVYIVPESIHENSLHVPTSF